MGTDDNIGGRRPYTFDRVVRILYFIGDVRKLHLSGCVLPDHLGHLRALSGHIRDKERLTSGVALVAGAVSWLIVLLYVVFIMLDYERLMLSFRQLVPQAQRRRVYRISERSMMAGLRPMALPMIFGVRKRSWIHCTTTYTAIASQKISQKFPPDLTHHTRQRSVVTGSEISCRYGNHSGAASVHLR